jgi:RHS repeat-associated protein
MTCVYACANEHAFRGSLFTGKERDAESGNDYFEARYYSSAMGRFMSPDWSAKEDPVPYAVMDDPQSLNLYAYVRNNPLIRADADGHQFSCPPPAVCGPPLPGMWPLPTPLGWVPLNPVQLSPVIQSGGIGGHDTYSQQL